jgi:hypothetical protein
MRRSHLFFISVIICGFGTLSDAGEYGTSVVTFLPGTDDVASLDLVSNSPCSLTSRPVDLVDVLGPPNGKFVSIGHLGFVGIEFPHDIVDMPGPDVAVWASCNTDCQSAAILVTHDPAAGWGQVATMGAASYAEFDIFFDPGAPPVRYLAVLDGGCTGLEGGVDIDAVANLQFVVTVKPTTWGAIKALYR